jgi:AraC-like DNA-binding protein
MWMPEGARPHIVMHGRVSIRTLYLDRRLPVPLDGWRAVNVARLLRELIIHAVGQAPLDLARAEHERLIGVLLDQLAGLAQGEPVTTVALAVGYRTPSAFTAMFHEQLGTTPTRYFQPDR